MVFDTDNHGRRYASGMNCSICGRFVGKDGHCDIIEADTGVFEVGYPMCGRCLEKQGKTPVAW